MAKIGMKPASIDKSIEIHAITVKPNEYIAVYLYTPASEAHGTENEWTRIECRVTPLGRHELYCDNLDAKKFEKEEWEDVSDEQDK